MNKRDLLFLLSIGLLLVLLVLLSGCTTTMDRWGSQSDLGVFTGHTRAKYSDPSRPVDPGQVAAIGINGPSGPYAAAVAVGAIKDPKTQELVANTITQISASENIYGYGGRGFGRGGAVRRDNRLALGMVSNDSNYSLLLAIPRVGNLSINPGEHLEIEVPRGIYLVDAYHNDPEDRQRYNRLYKADREVTTDMPSQFDGVTHDFHWTIY